jgi:SpoVK/Ycf46/Vps4 family AAA+-type ATPase
LIFILAQNIRYTHSAIDVEWDEDGTSGVNERILSTLLNEMDGIGGRGQVLVVAATNQPQLLDDALLRPGMNAVYNRRPNQGFNYVMRILGRLDRHIYVPLPTIDDREAILSAYGPVGSLSNENDPAQPFWEVENSKDESAFLSKNGGEPWNPRKAAEYTFGFSCADLRVLLREAGMMALRERGSVWLEKIQKRQQTLDASPGALNIARASTQVAKQGPARVRGIVWRHVQSALDGAMRGSWDRLFDGAFEKKVIDSIWKAPYKWWRPGGVTLEEVRQFEKFRDGKSSK